MEARIAVARITAHNAPPAGLRPSRRAPDPPRVPPVMQNSERLLTFPALLNARDLGGYPTVDGGKTRWRSLLRSDDLAQLTPVGIEALAAFGVQTVLDLR